MDWKIGRHYPLIVESTGQCPYCLNVRDYDISGGGTCVDIRDSHCRNGSYLIYFEMDREIPACPHCGKRGKFYMHEIDSLDMQAHALSDEWNDDILDRCPLSFFG